LFKILKKTDADKLLVNNINHFTAIIQDNLYQTAPPLTNWRILLEQFYCPHALAEKTLEFSSKNSKVMYIILVPLDGLHVKYEINQCLEDGMEKMQVTPFRRTSVFSLI